MAMIPSDTTNESAIAEDVVLVSEGGAPESEDDTSFLDGAVRKGTLTSARFNVLSTMVGGGMLSLPLAFERSGNALLAPLLMLVIAAISDFVFRVLVVCTPPAVGRNRGNNSFESVSERSLGRFGRSLSTVIVVCMCFFASVAYCVLLRDMLEPIADAIFPQRTLFYRNLAMLAVVLVVTPLTSLQTITSLQKFGAAGMLSMLILGSCVVYRSVQCNVTHNWRSKLRFWPDSSLGVLDTLPLFISSYVCHFNVLAAHNEMRDPTPARVSWWLRSTTWGAAILYLVFGLAGSLYANCTDNGHVQGNILLDFGENDPVLMVGRLCLAFTISMAFPMLVIPTRDVFLRLKHERIEPNQVTDISSNNDLEEPLLLEIEQEEEGEETDTELIVFPFWERLLVATAFFWLAASIACTVGSIEVVWDLLGSSFSILMCYIIPSATYLILTSSSSPFLPSHWGSPRKQFASRVVCWILLIVFTPLMFVSTAYAIYNAFFHHNNSNQDGNK